MGSKFSVTVFVMFSLIFVQCAPDGNRSRQISLYLGLRPPGLVPEIFAPEIVNTEEQVHSCVAISPDGDQMFWSLFSTISEVRQERIWFSKMIDREWSPPRIASFSSAYREGGPRFSYDGNRLYYTSCRPLGPEDSTTDANLWVVRRTRSGWGDPEPLSPIVNTEFQEWFPSIARNGNVYYMFRGADPDVLWDICVSEFVGGCYTVPRRLGDTVNTHFVEGFPFVDPYEKYLIFYSERSGGYSEYGELYVCFKQADGTWSEAENMGPAINAGFTRFPGLSPDGKWFFFSCMKADIENIYWMDAGIIKTFRSE